MEVWFSIVRNPGREANTRAEPQKEIYTRAPPQRVGRARALLTKTYHGSRITGQVRTGTLRTRGPERPDEN
jgi:hypothetical protein